MKNFYLIANEIKDPGEKHSRHIQAYLEQRGAVCSIMPRSGASASFDRHTDPSAVPADTECVLVLGGDGTLLRAARDLNAMGLPLLGINLGTLGYLAEIEIQSVEDALDRLLTDSFYIEERMMLHGDIVRQGRTVLSDTALNDIVIIRRGRLRVVDFNVYVDDVFLCACRADGIILSTPTGSTGYSLSAGGPIVSPDASLILLTAIAPHTLNTRPIVLPDRVSVTVEIGGDPGMNAEGAEVIFDGDTSLHVGVSDRICVALSSVKAKLVKIHHTSFVEMLRSKMN